MAVPDWPTTFGYNMFTFPFSKMVGGIFYEHSHRLIGSLVGFLTIGLSIAIIWKDNRKWLKVLSVVALFAVIAQGIMGGMRVVEISKAFALACCLAHRHRPSIRRKVSSYPSRTASTKKVHHFLGSPSAVDSRMAWL